MTTFNNDFIVKNNLQVIGTGTSTFSGSITATGFTGVGTSLTSLTAGNLTGTIPSAVLGNSTVYIGTTAILLNRATASISLTGVSIDGSAASATKSTNIIGGNSTTLLGSIPYQSNTDTTTLLSPNTSTTKQFLSQTGTGTNGAVPAWSVVSKSDVGLGSVENTALSTWAGTSNITTVGAVTGTSFNSITGLANTLPIINGTATIGTSTLSARQDHIHPIDTTRAATSGNLSQFAATTSAQLAGVLSDETGYSAGAFAVFNISPSISTSIISGTATFDLINTTATTVNIAGAATTGNIFSTATATATLGIGTGATTTGNTKTINFGTGGATGSTTNINIGSSIAGTTTINSSVLATTMTTISGTPTNTTDVTSKTYVDAKSHKDYCVVATFNPIPYGVANGTTIVISNPTITFSSTPITDTINIPAHSFNTGDPVRLTPSVQDGSNYLSINGVSQTTGNTATWYVIKPAGSLGTDNIELATSVGNAFAGISATISITGTVNVNVYVTTVIDAVAFAVGYRILVKNQTSAQYNGIYTVTNVTMNAWTLTRTGDFDAWLDILGSTIPVLQGTVNSDSIWLCTNNYAGTFNTTAITFTPIATVTVAISNNYPSTPTTPILSLTNTWYDSTIIFSGLKLNITNTASSDSSTLLDLQVSSASKFRVDKYGQTILGTTGIVGSGPILTLGTLSAGSGYRDGVFTSVAPTTSGSGLYALATVSVGGGIVQSVTLTWGGHRYAVNDTLTIPTLGTTIATTGASGDSTTATITFNAVSSLATTAASGDGTTATITFAAQTNPPYPVGSKVTLATIQPAGYQGTYTVTACTTTTVSFLNSTTGSQSVAGTVSIIPFNVGQNITLATIQPSGYQGTYTVTAATNTSVSYANATTGSQTVAGTVTSGAALTSATVPVATVQTATLTVNRYISDSIGPRIRLEVEDTGVNTAQELGAIIFASRDASANSSGDLALIRGISTSTTGGTYLEFQVAAVSSAPAVMLTLNSSALNLVSGAYQIGGVSVLNSTTLGSGITASSLTSVGTLTSLTTSGQITSNLATGTAPLNVTSTTLCTNLNSNYIGGIALSGLLQNPNSVTKSGNYTLVSADSMIPILVSAAATITLPIINTVTANFKAIIKNISTTTVTVTGQSSQKIDGLSNIILQPYEVLYIMTDGTSNWYLI